MLCPYGMKKSVYSSCPKKDNSDDPANFRPITLASVPLKVFTSCLRDSVFSLLKQNEFTEAEIQKGFATKMAGVFEHTSMTPNIIDEARIYQLPIVM